MAQPEPCSGGESPYCECFAAGPAGKCAEKWEYVTNCSTSSDLPQAECDAWQKFFDAFHSGDPPPQTGDPCTRTDPCACASRAPCT